MFKYLLFSSLLFIGCSDDHYAIQTDAPYYLTLKKQCHNNSCCLGSLKAMVETQSKLAQNDSCPTGYRRMMMRCVDSYVWCEKSEG